MLSKREQAKIRRRDEAALAKDEEVDWTPQLEREQENRGKEEGRVLDTCILACTKDGTNIRFIFKISNIQTFSCYSI